MKINKQNFSYELRDIIDWDYYIEKLSFVVQKMISIPAALQGVKNPCPEIAVPDWLKRRVKE